MTQQCHYCDRPAEFLCDFVLDFSTTIDERIIDEMTIDEFLDVFLKPNRCQLKRCDRPLCSIHRKQVGVQFLCGSHPEAGPETIDMCPGHAEIPTHEKPPFDPIRPGGPGKAA